MKTLIDVAAELGIDRSGLRRRAMKFGIPLAKAIDPVTRQTVLVLTPAAEKALRDLYPKKLILRPAAEGVSA